MPQVALPKGFFQKERRDMYANWPVAFFRELCQNSVDGKAKRIAVRLSTLPSGFVRVVFIDDGQGMSRDVLEHVYFKLGETTKNDGDSIGGFGRARILTCFSQARYRITTRDVVADGEGADYTISDGHKSQAGCHIEIDVDGLSERITEATMTKALQTYLAESQLACQVGITGAHIADETMNVAPGQWLGWKNWARRGRVADRLLDAAGTPFATVHIAESGKIWHRNTVIVRVAGASMFTMWTEAPVQVIIEIDPARSREVLMASRDRLRMEYDAPLRSFLDRLATDHTNTLKDKTNRRTLHYKGAGVMRQEQPKSAPVGAAEAAAIMAAPGGVTSAAALTSGPAIDSRDDAGPLITRPHRHHDAVAVLDGGAESLPDENWDPAEPSAAPGVEAPPNPFGFPDLYIHEEAPPPALRRAMRNYLPTRWQPGGDGANARKLLAMWHAALVEPINAYLKLSGKYQIDWTVGWYFGGRDDYGDQIQAQHQTISENGKTVHIFLLNPFDEDGHPRFKLTERAALKQLLATARHEVAHIGEETHNRNYAYMLTGIDAAMNDDAAYRRMKDAADAIRDIERTARSSEPSILADVKIG